MKCPLCGKELGEFIHDLEYVEERGMCFSCSIWKKRYEELSSLPKYQVAIIDGTYYSIGPEDDTPKSCRGFGGDKFVIRFKDGYEVTTTNLWCGGKIDDYWQNYLSNNADFDWQWKKIGKNNYLVPKEEEIPDSLIAQAESNLGM